MKYPLEVETISVLFKKQPTIITKNDIKDPKSKTIPKSPELQKNAQ